MQKSDSGSLPVCSYPECGCIEELECGPEKKARAAIRNSDDCNPISIDPAEQEVVFSLLFMLLQNMTQMEIQNSLDEDHLDFTDKLRGLLLELVDNLKLELDEEDYILVGIRDRVSLETLTDYATSSGEGMLTYISNYLILDRSLQEQLDPRTIPIE